MKTFFITACLIVILSSCYWNKSCEGCGPMSGEKEATIIWTGPIEADGCDWEVKDSDQHIYHPESLPAAFKKDNLQVKIKFTLTNDTFRCGIAAMGVPVIHITNIR